MRALAHTFFIYFLLLSFAMAQVPGAPIPLNKGDLAPADGVFLFTVDAAKLLGQLQTANDRCDAIKDAAIEKATAPFDLKLKLCLDEKSFLKELTAAKISAKNEYIEQLEKRVSDPGISRSWVLGGGIILGVLLTIGAGVAMNHAAAN